MRFQAWNMHQDSERQKEEEYKDDGGSVAFESTATPL